MGADTAVVAQAGKSPGRHAKLPMIVSRQVGVHFLFLLLAATETTTASPTRLIMGKQIRFLQGQL
jgi:hypothetical protein